MASKLFSVNESSTVAKPKIASLVLNKPNSIISSVEIARAIRADYVAIHQGNNRVLLCYLCGHCADLKRFQRVFWDLKLHSTQLKFNELIGPCKQVMFWENRPTSYPKSFLS